MTDPSNLPPSGNLPPDATSCPRDSSITARLESRIDQLAVSIDTLRTSSHDQRGSPSCPGRRPSSPPRNDVPLPKRSTACNRTTTMADRDGEVKHSTLNDDYGSDEPRGDAQRSRLFPETPTTTRTANASGTMELRMLATTMQMMARLLERQMEWQDNPVNTVNGNDATRQANENAAIQITTIPDLTATLPTFSGTDESVGEWITSVESMRERCSWKDMAMLNAAISRLRGRAAAWHRTDGVSLKSWTTWVAALRKDFDKQPLFCEWVENVNARRQKEDETITDYSDDDIVEWLIQGVRLEGARPVIAAFHDLRKGSGSEFINYARQFDRRMTSTRSDGPYADDHQESKPTRLPGDIRDRCLQRGHRAKDCPRPDKHTEEEKVAAARRKEERAAREQRTNRIVTARSDDSVILRR
ncbi:hypothetical protein HPB49_024783 [Dermacentor silvarum]|uniref:Uncharacterized protein n=1 Tax=Dermacentor silvarum TaxID=543639 RepID=A0ACB8DLN3_DERSI|nr:hypothetical protein HPB49_024783 [Dermacentor silvarum]